MPERDHDLVLLGATGYTGALTAEHLARRLAGTNRSWAIAGRNPSKLEEVRGQVAAHGSTPDIEVVDVTDLVGLVALAERTRVLATTVGPYARHGELVVQACVRGGADYLDITGEPAFVDLCLARYDGDAAERGVRVVNCCGFDSIPHDLGARFTVDQLPSDAPLTVRGYVRGKGQPSGGTWSSALDAMGQADLRGLSGPKPRRDGPRRARGLPMSIARVPDLGGWAVPMPTIDPAVVLRSARALPAYGPDFRYGHYVHLRRTTTMLGMVGGAGLLVGLAKVPPVREQLKKLNPAGDGPTAEERAAAWFEVTFVGEGGGRRVTTRVRGDDPGYGGTAIMLGEAALSLVEDDLPETSGVVTTAEAFEGGHLQRRLEAHGMTFEVL